MSNFESKEVDPSQEKDLADSVVAREISQEIMRYGVSQFQIKKIIKFLALELEDNVMMKKICDVVEGVQEDTSKKTLIIKE
tara:strand:+ start:1585 stop:1827 length:243 start_codon:yes stop_codon:yes gene_type:complete